MDLSTGATHRLTDWQNHVVIVPSSFSPDGSTLAATKTVGSSPVSMSDAIALPVKGGPATFILEDAVAPVYSPDGTRIAFARDSLRHRKSKSGSPALRLTNLYTAAPDGSDVQRLTSTPNATEVTPAWDPSGQRLAFVRVHPSGNKSVLPFSDEIAEINADGTCPARLISDPGAVFFSGGWQPGAGRAAGPITC